MKQQRVAKAAVNSAKAQLNTAKLTYANNEKLFKNNVIGTYELQSSKNSLEAAQAASHRLKPTIFRPSKTSTSATFPVLPTAL